MGLQRGVTPTFGTALLFISNSFITFFRLALNMQPLTSASQVLPSPCFSLPPPYGHSTYTCGIHDLSGEDTTDVTSSLGRVALDRLVESSESSQLALHTIYSKGMETRAWFHMGSPLASMPHLCPRG